MLYIVATPIGNLKDITLRALEVLQSVDLIACEDTRHTKILLDHYGIKTPTTSYFQHNRLTKGAQLLKELKEGREIALVCDAGTPGILDPGYHLINVAIENKIDITVIPGPSAFVNALVLSGKPTHEFIFVGFLPPRQQARKNRLRALAKHHCTIVLYESRHRLIATLRDIQEVFGDTQISVVREVTKKFEQIKRDTASNLITHFSTTAPRGEFTLVI